MTGLILKDFYNILQQIRILAIVFCIFFITDFMSGEISTSMGFIIMVSCILVVSTFSYDSHCKWDSFALSLSVTKHDIVISKYIFSLLLMGFAAIVTIIFGICIMIVNGFTLSGLSSLLFTIFLVCIIATVFISILLPAIFKYGVEKSRIIIIGLFMIPFVLIMLLSTVFSNSFASVPDMVLGLSPVILILALLIVVVTIVVISIKTSVSIYSNKDI